MQKFGVGRGRGGEPFLAAEAERVERPACHGDKVTRGDGEEVNAGDDVGALELELHLGAHHGFRVQG